MLDRTPRHKELQTGFKMFCEKLLTREGFLITESGWKQKLTRSPQAGPDLIIKRPTEPETMVVEAKFYRSKRIEPALLRNAVDELKKHRDAKKAHTALLIVTAEFPAGLKAEVEKQGVMLWDLLDVLQLTAKTPTLADTLSDLLRDGDPGGTGREQFAEELVTLDEQSPRLKGKTEGARLAAEFEQTKPGREGARKFEQLCDKAVRHLFAEQFQRWVSQVAADDGSGRPELIGRLVGRHEFWVALAEDFRSRTVVFFFRNGAEPLTSGDVLSAGRHLYAGALRTVAVIIARGAADAGARRACQQLLRDEGKLVLCLSAAELRDLLLARDGGDEYMELLIDRTAELMLDVTP